MKVRYSNMPKKSDPNLTYLTSSGKKMYKSQNNADKNAEYDKTQDKVIIRLPKGSNSIIKAYVENKAIEEPDNRKYSTDKGRPSVNAFIKTLIEDEIGQKLD